MNYVKQYLSKPVLNLHTADFYGEIISAYFDSKLRKLMYCEVFDGNESFYLPFDEIYATGDAVIITDENALISQHCFSEENTQIFPIEAKMYSDKGLFMGILFDCGLTVDGKVTEMVIDGKSSPPLSVFSYTKETVIIKTMKKTSPKKPKLLKCKEDSTVFLLEEPHSIRNLYSLVGKISPINVFDDHSNVIIKKQSVISLSSLQLAFVNKSSNALIQLLKKIDYSN